MASIESECLLNEVLDHIFQITGERLSLKNEQKEAVNSLLSGKDVLAVQLTGFGKGLIFHLFANAKLLEATLHFRDTETRRTKFPE